MQTITLGESGLECSRLAYGCWRVTGVIHHPPIDEEHEKKSHESIKAAFDAGYTLFDLSDVDSDGLVEEVFGRTLKEVSGMRDRIVIATKCGIREKGDPDKDAPTGMIFPRNTSPAPAKRRSSGWVWTASTSTSCTGRIT